VKTETLIWTVVLVLAGAWLILRTSQGNMGLAYERLVEKQFVRVDDIAETYTDGEPTGRMIERWVPADSPEASERLPGTDTIEWTESERVAPRMFHEAEATDPQQADIRFSFRHTLGLWVAAIFTLAIFSFLYKDNPLYRLAEAVVVGVSAAYWMVVGFWTTIVPNLFGKLFPPPIKDWAMPDLPLEQGYARWLYLVPLILGIMLLWRLAPKGAWIARWPLAYIIGTTAGLRLFSHMQADFVAQINNVIIPLVEREGGVIFFWESLANITIILGVLACLVYFFFSIEHKGVFGKTARVGIWVLMITFGASFGYTVMGRIALLAIRLEFLFDDWLWLIDPAGRRLVGVATSLIMTIT